MCVCARICPDTIIRNNGAKAARCHRYTHNNSLVIANDSPIPFTVKLDKNPQSTGQYEIPKATTIQTCLLYIMNWCPRPGEVKRPKKFIRFVVVRTVLFIKIQFIYYLFANAVNFSIKIAEQTIYSLNNCIKAISIPQCVNVDSWHG